MTAENKTAHPDNWSLYPYQPAKPLPILFAVGFLTCGALMLYQCITRYGLKRYTFTMTFTSIVWAAGFGCRMASIYKDENIDIFIAQYVLLFLGPPLFAGAEYFILGRVLAYIPYHMPIHPGRVLSTFIILDTVVEVLAINGASANASAKTVSERSSGLSRMLASLVIQAILELGFLSLVALVERRCRKAKLFPRNLRIVTCILYVTSLMMLVRCIFRIIEGFEVMDCPLDLPNCGSVDRHEWFFYVFEVANIFLFVLLLTIFPPGKYLPPSDKVYLDPLDGTERVGPGFVKADTRPLWRTVLDPFNVHGLITGSGLVEDKFWERDNLAYKRENAASTDKPKAHAEKGQVM
ncbi:hypothetical protein MMC21_004212 [Puttea exsequens]|nr:hypothetical protein [Puttea exsequens]